MTRDDRHGERTRRFIDSLRGRPLVIYGAGKIAHRLVTALRFFGLEPVAVWDNHAERIDGLLGLPVTRPAPEALAARGETVAFVTIFAQDVSRAIAAELEGQGLGRAVHERELIDDLIYLECLERKRQGSFRFDRDACHLCPVAKELDNPCPIHREALARELGLEARAEGNGEALVIPSMGVLITNHCNLTCGGCNHLRDLYRPEDNVSLAPGQILDDLRRIVDAVDLIEKVVVVGGEALVHKRVAEILARILELPRIGEVQIITNGTVIPKDEKLFELLAERRVMVEVSAYEGHLPEKAAANLRLFLEKLKGHGIRHRYLNTLEWFDFGDFSHRHYPPGELHRVYKECCFISNDLFDGRLHKCSRSVFAARLGLIPDYPGDYVDVRATPPEALPGRLRAFFANEYPQVCQHCNGTSNRRIPAGVQVVALPLPHRDREG